MLQRIRDNSSGPLAYAVVAVIVLVFGVWGIGSYLTPSPNKSVATAAGSDISKRQLRSAVNQRYQQLKARRGEQFDPDKISRPDVRRAALQQLIQSQLTTQYAKNAGYQVSNGDVLAFLKQKAAFQKNGSFSTQRYKQALKRAGVKPARYEAGVRQQLLSRVVESEIRSQAFAVPRAVTSAYDRLHEKRRVAVLRFAPSQWQASVEISDQAIRKAYENASKQYRVPARVKLAYVVLDADKLDVQADTDQAHLKKLYKQNRARFRTPAKRAGEVLRIPIAKDEAAAARDKAQQVQEKLSDGQTMAQVAKSLSGVRHQQIELTTQQNADGAIANALFETDKNTVSNPVHGDDAWLVVRPTKTVPASEKQLSDSSVQKILKQIARQKAKRAAFKAKRKKLGDLAYQAPNSLKTIAGKLDLSIQTSDWMSRESGQGIGTQASIRQAAFSSDVKQKKLNSDVIKIADERAAVVRLSERKASHKKPLADVRSQIVADLKQDKARAKAQTAAANARKKLASGDVELADLAQSNPHASLAKPGLISRSSGKLDGPVKQAVFDMPPPDSGQTAYSVVDGNDGSVVLIAVSDVVKPGAPKSNQEKRQHDMLAARQRRYTGTLEYAAFSDWLRQTRDVTIHEDALKATGRRSGS
ncbi:hypothetical protein HKX42_00880 [Salinisphaera sp. USBA-960]|uniref:SurA N-terminal domain-containing protein n=1 Tax=Salinisphaera orenii TaxID=856731 RepID=UPI000DBE8909|nr:hypothetical protein [Salifodinibacter halophilus]NNC25436.1 hypothetical protein [Salifodinibacter halophilus]